MSEPVPVRPDRPAYPTPEPPAGPPLPPGGEGVPTAKLVKNGENGAKKSSPVIARSYRVRELPPPPKILPDQPPEPPPVGPAPEPPEDPPAVEPELAPPPIELSEINIEPPSGLLRRRRRRYLRASGPWQRWLADPNRRRTVGYTASLLAHLLLILLLVIWGKGGSSRAAGDWTHVRKPAARPVVASAAPEPLVVQSEGVNREAVAPAPRAAVPHVAAPTSAASAAASRPLAVANVDTGMPGLFGPARGKSQPDLLLAVDTPVAGKLQRRTPSARSEGVRYNGGTVQSEESVQRALRWLVAHQHDDGSWNFNHVTDACLHYCTNPGTEGSTTAATGLALLPFLGAGYTHQDGEYQESVRRALAYLRTRSTQISYGNDLRDGSPYGQGLATIALCEAYGMTHDPALRELAQGGIDYIVYCQDPQGGGWRYNPGASGDTTVTGWMLMALKSGQMARLNVPSPAIFLAERFLTSVQNQDGSLYGYMSRKPRQTTTAVGLLCRMYTGWRRDNPGLVQGVAHLNGWGPSPDNLYYNYYATQVMFHWSGPPWDSWNQKMRELLTTSQGRVGHESGSWYFAGNHGTAGGRLYSTAVAAMILEVYYRYMPLYSEAAIDGK